MRLAEAQPFRRGSLGPDSCRHQVLSSWGLRGQAQQPKGMPHLKLSLEEATKIVFLAPSTTPTGDIMKPKPQCYTHVFQRQKNGPCLNALPHRKQLQDPFEPGSCVTGPSVSLATSKCQVPNPPETREPPSNCKSTILSALGGGRSLLLKTQAKAPL